MAALIDWLDEQSGASIVVFGLVLAAAIGSADAMFGSTVSLAGFQVLPVLLVAWFAGRSPGLLQALVGGALGITAAALAPASADARLSYLGAAVNVATLSLAALLACALRASVEGARADPLTGLLNARAFSEMARVELERARRFGRPLTMAYLDVDGLESINRRHGRRTGDHALRFVGEALRTIVRTTDVVARLGDDDFLVLLTDADVAAGKIALNRIHAGLTAGRQPTPLTFSIGAVTLLEAAGDADGLVRKAEEVLVEAKHERKAILHRVARGAAERTLSGPPPQRSRP
jgi:diguanylate cyclase (GGDEF)-like protein